MIHFWEDAVTASKWSVFCSSAFLLTAISVAAIMAWMQRKQRRETRQTEGFAFYMILLEIIDAVPEAAMLAQSTIRRTVNWSLLLSIFVLNVINTATSSTDYFAVSNRPSSHRVLFVLLLFNMGMLCYTISIDVYGRFAELYDEGLRGTTHLVALLLGTAVGCCLILGIKAVEDRMARARMRAEVDAVADAALRPPPLPAEGETEAEEGRGEGETTAATGRGGAVSVPRLVFRSPEAPAAGAGPAPRRPTGEAPDLDDRALRRRVERLRGEIETDAESPLRLERRASRRRRLREIELLQRVRGFFRLERAWKRVHGRDLPLLETTHRFLMESLGEGAGTESDLSCADDPLSTPRSRSDSRCGDDDDDDYADPIFDVEERTIDPSRSDDSIAATPRRLGSWMKELLAASPSASPSAGGLAPIAEGDEEEEEDEEGADADEDERGRRAVTPFRVRVVLMVLFLCGVFLWSVTLTFVLTVILARVEKASSPAMNYVDAFAQGLSGGAFMSTMAGTMFFRVQHDFFASHWDASFSKTVSIFAFLTGIVFSNVVDMVTGTAPAL